MPYHDPFGSTQPTSRPMQPAAETFGPAPAAAETSGQRIQQATTSPVGGSPFSTAAAAATSPFGAFQAGGGPITVNRPPVVILAGCAVIGVGAALAAWLSGVVAVAFGSWALAGPVAMGLLALFQHRDAVAQSRGVYARPGWVTPAFYAGVLICLLAVCVCAFRIAIWAGRL